VAGRLRSQLSHVASQHHSLKEDHLMLSAEGMKHAKLHQLILHNFSLQAQ